MLTKATFAPAKLQLTPYEDAFVVVEQLSVLAVDTLALEELLLVLTVDTLAHAEGGHQKRGADMTKFLTIPVLVILLLLLFDKIAL
ncbi:hypothetical protein PF005_g15262 [Phytophthora fragariae]|uniref:Uncharacterized protein n=1 Tax=Phytophthora fragariae TaxID=53985 RepID=A0A6A3F3Y9_9STRA|nr:hypothetical protein PF009_g9700 [Phytophthora fragariae]KAE9099189.1 hypothetical protein PF007_g15967 [Phytophthora fragariae]KAE9200655.1 hypothetical protein PF005_g15262 [Phytophthora fragariae]KAE9213206.1 hypothetical protein PF004_g15415 [Phytophthora fragariae]